MTDRTCILTVTLDRDYRTDDVQPILSAIAMIKGVIHVGFEVADFATHGARIQARRDIADKLYAVLEASNG